MYKIHTNLCVRRAPERARSRSGFFCGPFQSGGKEYLSVQLVCECGGSHRGLGGGCDLVLKNGAYLPSSSFVPSRMLQDRGLSSQPGLLENVLELKETHCSPYLLAFLFDCYEDALESSFQKDSMEHEHKETLKKALEVSDC